MKLLYTEGEICNAAQKLVDRGIDLDTIPLDCTIEDLIRLAEDFERPN